MTSLELKENIKKKLDRIEDITILKEADNIINYISLDRDIYKDLPEELKNAIEDGLTQLDNGKKISYEEVKKRNARWFRNNIF